MSTEPITTAQILVHGFMAFFGALTHATRSHASGNSKSVLDFIMLTLMSSFSGVMFSLIGLQYFGESSYMTLALAGTGGYLGVEGMTLIVNYLRERFFATAVKEPLRQERTPQSRDLELE